MNSLLIDVCGYVLIVYPFSVCVVMNFQLQFVLVQEFFRMLHC
jgi:hypothetical protein